MTKKPTLIAEREQVQDTGKGFDEQVYNDGSFFNTKPYPMTSVDSSSDIDAPTIEPPDNLTKTAAKLRTAKPLKRGLAITPYPEAIPTKSKSKSDTNESLKNPRLGNEAVFNENIVDRFSSVKGKSDKWQNVKTIALITTIVAIINTISIILGYINGEISGLGSIIGSGIMFVVLFLIVLFSWFTIGFVRNIPIRGHYSRADIKTKRVVAKYEPALKSYFLDFIATKTVRERLNAISATPPDTNTIKAVTNFDNNINDKTLSSRAVMLTGMCTRGESKIPVSVTLNFNKNYSKLLVQDYKVG